MKISNFFVRTKFKSGEQNNSGGNCPQIPLKHDFKE